MGIARSTYYDAPKRTTDDTALVEVMYAIKDEFEAYGWRRMQAALGQQGWIVNHKKLKRLMREHGLNARRRRRYVATTDSDHDQPIFPNRTRGMIVDGPDQLWVADLTYVAVAVGFVYVAVIMDAWSRRIIGYAMSRRIDARLTLAALDAAIALRHPPPGCVHHTDRGSQLGFKWSSQHPDAGGCDDAEKAEVSPIRTGSAALAGATAGWATPASTSVLVCDRGRSLERGRRSACGGIAARGNQVVPGGRRDATIAICALGEAAVRAIPVLRRTGGDRAVACPGSRRARDRASDRAGGVHAVARVAT
jgi:putative transposase